MLGTMRLSRVIEVLTRLAPEHLAEDWDHVGLQLGDMDWPVRRALLCIDLSEPVLAEAVRKKADLVVAYHPPIFSPLSALTAAEPRQRLILEAARRQIAIYSPHTALDAAPGGVNDWLIGGLGKGQVGVIRPTRSSPGTFKIVTFVPHEATDRLRQTMAAAGAGQIGDYHECSFMLDGEGTFIGGESTRPAVGQRLRLEKVAERRLEMVCPASVLDRVVAALRASHPYEEPAFDIYAVQEPSPAPEAASGHGRLLMLDESVTISRMVERIKTHLGMRLLEMAAPRRRRPIRKVGLCAGAGGSLLAEADEIDLFFTGEMRHHDVLAAVARGTAVILAGHTQTERPYLPLYRRRIIRSGARQVDWIVSRTDRPPGQLV